MGGKRDLNSAYRKVEKTSKLLVIIIRHLKFECTTTNRVPEELYSAKVYSYFTSSLPMQILCITVVVFRTKSATKLVVMPPLTENPIWDKRGFLRHVQMEGLGWLFWKG